MLSSLGHYKFLSATQNYAFEEKYFKLAIVVEQLDNWLFLSVQIILLN